MSADTEHIALSGAASGEQAEILLAEIYHQLGEASANEIVLEQSWMRLGELLLKFKQGECWRPLGFTSFENFMLSLRDKYKRGKTQLWSYLTVAEKLLPSIPSDVLEEIGISKALELKRAITQNGGKPIPPELIAKARLVDITIKQLRAELGKAFNFAPDDKGTWFDLGGFFISPDERKEFVAGVKLTITLLGIKKDIPEHIQRKEIFLNWMREFAATHAPEIYGPAEPVNTPAKLMLPAASAVANE